MRLVKSLVLATAMSLVAAPVFAAANPAAPLSLSGARASAPSSHSQKLAGGTLIIALLATAAVIGGVVAATDNGHSGSS